MNRNGMRYICALAIAVLGGMSLKSEAATLDFYCLTNTSPTNCAIGEAQLAVTVSSYGSGQVLFWFTNTGPDTSTITDIYFDDGSLLGISTLIDVDEGVGGNAGVDYSVGASPGELLDASLASPAFVTTAGFSADSDIPIRPSGVEPGEWLGIVFSLQGGQTYTDVLSELTSGDLRIGVHVQGFAMEGGSQSFINNPLPVPAAFWLFGSGLLGLVVAARHKR